DEAKERLRASFANSQIKLPKKRVALNLSPADIPKDSTSLDLAMAVAVMAQDNQIRADEAADYLFLGELGLDGRLNPVRGLIGRLLAAKKLGQTHFYIPLSNLDQAKLIPEITLKATDSLRDVYLDLSGTLRLKAIDTKAGHSLPQHISEALQYHQQVFV